MAQRLPRRAPSATRRPQLKHVMFYLQKTTSYKIKHGASGKSQNATTYPYPTNLAKFRPSQIRPVSRISRKNCALRAQNYVLWCSLVEPTPVYPGGRRGKKNRTHAKLPRLPRRREWRAKRATPCQAETVAIFAWGRELLPQRPTGYTGVGSTSEHHNTYP